MTYKTVADGKEGQQRPAEHLAHAEQHPARPAHHHRSPPARPVAGLRLKHEAQAVHLFADLRDEGHAHRHGPAEGGQAETEVLAVFFPDSPRGPRAPRAAESKPEGG
jgi:hypothetical protein